MFSVKFCVPVGEQYERIEISLPNGSGGDSYHIMVDGSYCGSIVKRNGVWQQQHINKHEFTTDDIQALGEIVDFFCH